MADRFLYVVAGGLAGFAIQRPAHEVFGPEADGQRQGQDNSSEQNAERQANDAASDAQTLQSNGHRENGHQPFHADTQEPRILQVHIDGPDQHAACKEPGNDDARDQNDDGGHQIGQIGEQPDDKLGRERPVKRGDADQEPDEDDDPGDRPSHQARGAG